MLHDLPRNELYFAAVTGHAKNEILHMRIPAHVGKAGKVFATGKPVIENKLEDYYKTDQNPSQF